VYIIKLERRPVVYNQTDFCFLPFSKQFRLVYGILGIVVVKVYLKLKTHDYNQRANISCIFISVVLFLTKTFLLWPPYGIWQANIFSSCGFFFLLFSSLSSAVAYWMSTTLPHMMWP